MARVKGIFNITGGLQNVSFYTIKGSDKVYARTKGGPSKRRIKTGPEFETLRKHQSEWKGCVLFSKDFKYCMGRIYAMRDFNVAPVLNGIAKKIIKLDTEHDVGERSILLSKSRETFEGFNFNRQFPFNSVFRTSLHVDINKKQGRMLVQLPRIVTKNDLYNVQKLPYFRLTFSLCYLNDWVYDVTSSEVYVRALAEPYRRGTETITEWFSCNDIVSEQQIELALENDFSDEDLNHLTAMGSVGIEFGSVGVGNAIEAVRYACCAKIVRTE